MSNLLNDEKFLVVPGVFNPFTALLAEKAGFKAAYLSGGALTSSYGIPDIGLITLKEIEEMVKKIREVTSLPLIVDMDTGFGEAINVYRAVKTLEAAGANAVHLEDQKMPKRCGHLNGKELIDESNMAEKIKAAIKARNKMLIIARTDARSVTGFDDAVKRAKAYVAAGADMVFPEALQTREEFKAFASSVKIPLMANMTEFGKTPFIKAGEFKKLGYKFVIFPVTLFRIAARSMEEALEVLKKEGTQENLIDKMMTREHQYSIIKYDEYEEVDNNTKI